MLSFSFPVFAAENENTDVNPQKLAVTDSDSK